MYPFLSACIFMGSLYHFCLSMRLIDANGKGLLIGASGEIYAPESLFLNNKYDNPNTKGAVSLSLRLLNVFAQAIGLSLPHRALEGHCLFAPELTWLSNLAFRPVEELESMDPRMLLRLAKSEEPAHRDRQGAVAASTASARLGHIGEYLDWYCENILTPRIRSVQIRSELRDRFEITVRDLNQKISGGTGTHPTQIRSLPKDVFVRLIREIWVNPEAVFRSEGGNTSLTVLRDRAIFLLACEGMRPGAIGNLALQDFLGNQVRIVDNVARRGEAPTEGTPVQKGARSNKQQYNSEHNMTLWPWTEAAIREYIQGERANLLSRRLRNASKGFLFLEMQYAGPVKSRKTIGLVFSRAARRLRELGLLSRPSADKYVKKEIYELTAYTLRHSAATLYMSKKGGSDQTRSEMKDRFGWTAKSNMPDKYGRRANMDAASVDLSDLWESIKVERLRKLECAQ